MLEGIMLRTRATGKSIEAYFQQFGSKTPQGLTEVTPDQFMEAVEGLDLPWGDDERQLRTLHEGLDQDLEKADRGTLAMTEIAGGVLDCVARTLPEHENEYLEITYTKLRRANRLS